MKHNYIKPLAVALLLGVSTLTISSAFADKAVSPSKENSGSKDDVKVVGAVKGLPGDKGGQGDKGPAGDAGAGSSFSISMTCGASGTEACKIGSVGRGGGWIFYVDYNDEYPAFDYLEAAPFDLSTPTPFCSDTYTEGDVNDSTISMYGQKTPTEIVQWANKGVGKGRGNTNQMLSSCSTGPAAQANAYANVAIGHDVAGDAGKWYVPSSGEMMLMYQNLMKAGVGGLFSEMIYRTSTEYCGSSAAQNSDMNCYQAWGQDSGNGQQVKVYKASHLPLRPITSYQ